MAERAPLVAVLAAGSAKRFGGGKLDAQCAGKPLGAWALTALSEASLTPGIIVVPPSPPAFTQQASGWTLVTNADAETGLGTSLAAAAAEALQQDAGSLLIALADMPLIPPEHLHAIANAPAPAATRYPNGKPGVPALFGADMLPDLASLTGDKGAAALLAAHPGLTLIDPPEGALTDIDTPEELEQASTTLRAQ